MQQNSLGRLCEICGSEGYAELITTCSVCNESSEHIYCMRNNLLEVPEFWQCEACQCPDPRTYRQEPVNAVLCCEEDLTPYTNTCFTFEEEDLPNPPAVYASWKGSFEIVDFAHELYDGFQAYPPRKALRKTYSVSKHMPGVLRFTLHSRCEVWQETFHTHSPSGFDISLYFCAEDSCRSKENYVRLLGLMEKQDLSIKSHLDGVELLIFTSRHLPSEYQRINKQFYLWGVFLSLEGRNSSVNLKEKQHAVDFPLLKCSLAAYSATGCHDVDDQVVDMEIDMTGGREVGRVDYFLRNNSTSACGDNSDVSFQGEQLNSKIGAHSASIIQEVDVHIVDMEIDMVGGREVGAVDKFLRRNSSAVYWQDSDAPSQDLFAKVHLDQPIGTSTVVKHLHQRKTEQCDVFEVPPGYLRSPKALAFLRPVICNAANIETIATSLVKMSPVALEVDPTAVKMPSVAYHVDASPGFLESTKLKEKGPSFKMEQGLGMHQDIAADDEKHIASVESTVGGLEGAEEDAMTCKVCREGYSSRPNDLLGIYSFSERVNVSTGTSASSRGGFVYTTISQFNVIHFRCHREAKRADVALKNVKKEWVGARLRNNGTSCNSIFPLRGPSVPMLQYVRFVGEYWDNLSALGQADGSRLHLLTNDIVLMLARFATGAPFNTNNKDQGRVSNSYFLPFMIQMARYLIDKNSSTWRQYMAKTISSYLSSFSSSTGKDFQLMLINSLLFESYKSWLIHRQAFLQLGIYHAYIEHQLGRSLLWMSWDSSTKNWIQPVLIFIGLIEQLQRFFKVDITGVEEDWEVIMKEKLLNLKEMMGFSEKILVWLEEMRLSLDLKEMFCVMGVLSDVLSGSVSKCEDFVEAAIRGRKC